MKKIVLMAVIVSMFFSSLFAAEFETEDSKLKKAISFLIAEHKQFKKDLQDLSEKLNVKSECNCTAIPVQEDKNVTEEPKNKKSKKKDKASKKNKKAVDANSTIQQVSFATESKKETKAE